MYFKINTDENNRAICKLTQFTTYFSVLIFDKKRMFQ